ncbi:TerL protein [Xanthomonas arboricola]|uniref:TerL protein n=1 Tax=Xanthomonas arboricola TaxID=56448 RepID=UPI0011B075B1|nr:TerL protein [Xanthomonas arboricola]
MHPPSTGNSWPLDYVGVWAWRQQQLQKLTAKPELQAGALAYYRTNPVAWINHWCDTYDPRNAGSDVPPRMPLVLFPRQAELVEFLQACLSAQEGGLIEKCRDMGATWVGASFSVWLWLFWPGAAIGWGSRKEQLVDKLGDPDSIFEKMRMVLLGVPRFFWPVGFKPSEHMTYMKLINPATGATITGEAGDNIGRGGRKLIYFKDESAHYERPEKIEAALADTTRVQIDISSVNGLGNVFHRRRESGYEWKPGADIPAGKTRVFIMDWRDHPAKTQDWYDARRAKAIDDGLLHVFAQEVDRNYSAAVDGVIIQAEWVKAAIDAHIKLKIPDGGPWGSALDVADGGGDRNAQVKRQGIVLRFAEEWGAPDTAETARRALANCTGLGSMELQYDSIGVGSGVKAEANNLASANSMPKGLRLVPWNAGAGPQNPEGRVIERDKDSPLNKDFYANLKAQGWWELRNRFYRTFRAVTEGASYAPDTLISLDSRLPLLRQIEKELSQATSSKGARMKLVVNKTPEGTRSPNLADAVVMAYWPMQGSTYNLGNAL